MGATIRQFYTSALSPRYGAAGAFFDFAANRFSHGFTHQRSGSAGYVTRTGRYALAPADTLRLDHRYGQPGVLLEGAGTNLLSHAIVDASAGWHASGATATDAGQPQPDLGRGVLVASGGATWHRLLHSARPAIQAGQRISFSVLLALGSSGRVRVVFRDNALGTEFSLAFDGMGIETFTPGQFADLAVGPADEHGQLWLTGGFVPADDGTLNFGIGPDTVTPGEDVLLRAAQLEQAPAPSSLIPSAGSPLSRGADQVDWGVADGLYDVELTRVDGTVTTLAAQSVTAGWNVPPSPVALSRVMFYASA